MLGAGPDRDQVISFLDGGNPDAESLAWRDAAAGFELSDDLVVQGDIAATGGKAFIQNHPSDPKMSVVYLALEGDEAGTYTRGSARLSGGAADVPLGATFAWVTNPDVGLTAHVTPRTPGAVLHVDRVTTERLVVRAAPGTSDDASFDFIVFLKI